MRKPLGIIREARNEYREILAWYLSSTETTEVIAFSHDSRQEGYWRVRLRRRHK